jgi:hypothetical protein
MTPGVRPRLPARCRGHRVEAARLALPIRSTCGMGEGSQSGEHRGAAGAQRQPEQVSVTRSSAALSVSVAWRVACGRRLPDRLLVSAYKMGPDLGLGRGAREIGALVSNEGKIAASHVHPIMLRCQQTKLWCEASGFVWRYFNCLTARPVRRAVVSQGVNRDRRYSSRGGSSEMEVRNDRWPFYLRIPSVVG